MIIYLKFYFSNSLAAHKTFCKTKSALRLFKQVREKRALPQCMLLLRVITQCSCPYRHIKKLRVIISERIRSFTFKIKHGVILYGINVPTICVIQNLVILNVFYIFLFLLHWLGHIVGNCQIVLNIFMNFHDHHYKHLQTYSVLNFIQMKINYNFGRISYNILT